MELRRFQHRREILRSIGRDTYTNSYCNSDTDTYSNPNANSNGNCNSDRNSGGDRDADCNGYAKIDSNTEVSSDSCASPQIIPTRLSLRAWEA